MLKNHIQVQLFENLKYSPTESQQKLIQLMADFIFSDDKDELLLVKGFAGTGKTTMVNALVKVLGACKRKSLLLAPTGRAAKVLASYSGRPAYTIHKKIYRQQSSKDGFGNFKLDRNFHNHTIFIIDEASMISNQAMEMNIFGSGRLLDDLVEYVYTGNNCKMILIGDTAQLPPVKQSLSPALDRKHLESYGLKVRETVLTDVVRQAGESGILFNATQLRASINIQSSVFPTIQLTDFSDIQPVTGDMLIEEISDVYDKYGMDETIIITRSNKRANVYNQGIRNSILWREEELSPGDILMVVKNNYFWLDDNDKTSYIANGDTVEVIKIRRTEELYGFRFADVLLRMTDYDLEIDAKIILDTLTIDAAALSTEDNKKLFFAVFDDFHEISSKKKRYDAVKNNAHFNALQVKFAYAVTCHKAQGGQWKAVFIDQGYLTGNPDVEYLRWMYTAFTRPTEKLYLVNFAKEMFGEGEG